MTAPSAKTIGSSSSSPTGKPTSWFYSRVMKPRLLAAFIWAMVATPLAGGVALAFLGAKEGLFGILFSLAPYRLLFKTALCVSLLSYISLRHSSGVVPRVRANRFAVLLALLRPGVFCGVALQAVLGGAVVKSVVGIASPAFDNLAFESLSSSSGDDDAAVAATTLHEGAVFVAVAGFFAALRIGVGDALAESAVLPSAIGVRLGKMVRIRKSLLPNLLSSLKEAVASIKWLFLLYFCFGEKIKESILCPSLATGHACSKSSSQIPMNSLLGLTEVGVLWKSFVAVSFLTFSHKLIKTIVTAYSNEPLAFPVVEAALADDDGIPTLMAALKSDTGSSVPPLAHLLAFQRLHDVLREGPTARKPFFSLSQPGGHPHSWNAVSSACFDHLKTILNGVTECNAAAPANLSTNNNNNHGKPTTTTTKAAAASTFRFSPLRYLIQEFPGAKARKVFVESSKSLFAVSSLSHLVSASFAEDDFGVVQKKLADILELLVSLYDAVEKNIKLYPCNGGLLSGSSSSSGDGRGISLFGSAVISDDSADLLVTARPALRDATKAAIYRIVMTFGNHLFGIHGLTTETTKRLKNFVEVKE